MMTGVEKSRGVERKTWREDEEEREDKEVVEIVISTIVIIMMKTTRSRVGERISERRRTGEVTRVT